ncbi:hypothetical protein CANINC_000376 [Pichia inconspicua]|uniref:Uncharacterized protein n=1 Tax=Pichia inconspicua TaxID=52247 RepID=A0A4T0X6P2_9ASCO|nr:hypothetical protein CANINC_000376 [[Candida] inconspicua]
MQAVRRHTRQVQNFQFGRCLKRALAGATNSVGTQGSINTTSSPLGGSNTVKKEETELSSQSPVVETLFTGSKPGASAILSGGVKHDGMTKEDQKQKFKSNASKGGLNGGGNANVKSQANNNVLGLEDEVIKLESFFDSYETVQRFRRCGFSDREAYLLMRYTYYKLEEKMQWLRENYSPKVDLENETYLFEAAHSELMFEVTNSREITLMNLTNEMIILKGGFNNLDDETIAQIKLNDDIIKMELNQFKHENNLHQKILNLKNSDLNSRIVSDMVSGLKSEIETFRWQLTRAGILSIMIMAVSILGVWNLARRSEEPVGNTEKGPLLAPLHVDTDEESHDYEADWDDQVHIQSSGGKV